MQWEGDKFTVIKQGSWSDHFFGLGDKPGPLDRKVEAFTMWNTDSFGWQESTDPIYKSIPFFIEMNQGRALGVFLDNTWRTNFDFGRADPNRYTFGAMNGPLDYYLLYGPEPKVSFPIGRGSRAYSAAAAVGARFPTVALHLFSGIAVAGSCYQAAQGSHSLPTFYGWISTSSTKTGPSP